MSLLVDDRQWLELVAQGLISAQSDPKLRIASLALSRLWVYRSGIQRHVQRLDDDLKLWCGTDRPIDLKPIFVDVHFYLILWDAILKDLKTIQAAGLPTAKQVYRQHRVDLEFYARGRDHLEHYADRLAGRTKRGPLPNPGDLGNIVDHTWTFAGEQWDFSPASGEKLLGIVDQFGAAVRADLAGRADAALRIRSGMMAESAAILYQ